MINDRQSILSKYEFWVVYRIWLLPITQLIDLLLLCFHYFHLKLHDITILLKISWKCIIYSILWNTMNYISYVHMLKDTYRTITVSFTTPIFHPKIYEKLCSELFHVQKGFNERVLLLLLRALELNNAVNISECTRCF